MSVCRPSVCLHHVCTRPSAPWQSHTQPSATAWAPIHMASLLPQKQARHLHTHAMLGGAVVDQPLLSSSAAAAFSRLAGRGRRGCTRRLRFKLVLAVLLGLVFIWAFSCPMAILTAVEANLAVGVSVVTGGYATGLLPGIFG